MINQYGFYIPFFEEHGIIYWESIVCVAFIIIILVLYYLRSLKKIMSNNHIKFNADEKSTYNGEVKDSIPNGKGSMIYNNSDFEDSHRINISRVVSKNLSKSDIRYLKDVAIDSIDRTTGDINYYITIREFTGNWKMGVWHGRGLLILYNNTYIYGIWNDISLIKNMTNRYIIKETCTTVFKGFTLFFLFVSIFFILQNGPDITLLFSYLLILGVSLIFVIVYRLSILLKENKRREIEFGD